MTAFRGTRLGGAVLCALVCVGAARGQQAGQSGTVGRGGLSTAPQATQPSMPSLVDDSNSDGAGSIEQQQARMRNNDRQKQLVDDSQKLLELATQLKAEVDKSTKDTLSLEVVRKADEIEKLAHSVKEKMKGS